MPEILHPPSSNLPGPRGIALLMVLLIVMAITIISMGFVARMDTELACGGNALLRVEMDQLAESALDHGRGLVLHPQDVPADFWTNGAINQQLVSASRDYYSLRAARDANQPTDYCTYDITSEAYRLSDGEKTGRSRLAAKLRLDPCIGLWTGGDLQFRKTWVLHGDIRSSGRIASLAAQESIDGDAFSSSLNGAIVGQHSGIHQLSLTWPPVNSYYTNPEYANGTVAGTLSGSAYPPAIWRASGDLVLAGNVTIEGMLLVEGNLTIRGNANQIRAARNLPALYVGGHLIIESVHALQIDGLVVVDYDVRVNAAATDIAITGALFVGGTLIETTTDVSGNAHTGLVLGNPVWTGGQWGGALELDGVDDHINCGTAAAFDLSSQVTVAAWVNTKDAGDGQHHPYVTKGDHTYALKHRHLTGDPTDYLEFFIYDGAWQSARTAVDASFNGEWHHLAGTYDGNDVRLYVDGVLKATTHHTGTIAVHPAYSLCIGANWEWPDRFYRGAIDDVRIFSSALNAAAINSVKAGVSITSGLVARWTLDEPGSALTVTADPRRAAIVAWESGVPNCWSPAAGSFYRDLRRL